MADNEGLIRKMRKADGVSMQDLADRMGISLQSVSTLERNEASGAIKLETLRRAANALGYELVTLLVPKQQNTLDQKVDS